MTTVSKQLFVVGTGRDDGASSNFRRLQRPMRSRAIQSEDVVFFCAVLESCVRLRKRVQDGLLFVRKTWRYLQTIGNAEFS